VSGICGDRFSTKKLISLGLIATTVMNLLMPLCTSPYQMLAVWCVNGFAQAFLWPPIVKTMVVMIRAEDYGRTMVKVAWGSSIGTMLVYLVSPILISLWNWKAVFVASAACGVTMLLVWNARGLDIPPGPRKSKEESGTALRAMFTPLMICIMVANMLHGMLRDSVMTWMPSYVSQTYHLDNSAAILSGVLLPMLGLLCFRITERLHRKVFPNLLTCASAIFIVSTLAAAMLYFCGGLGAGVAILLLALIKGSMNGINFLFISTLPTYFKKYGNISTVSGVLNSTTYIGSAISTYGIALGSVQYGWSASTFVWMLIGGVSTALCAVCIPAWRKAHPV
jgi:OPA family glycerol-3-phosphate transporter-like MFS transporter